MAPLRLWVNGRQTPPRNHKAGGPKSFGLLAAGARFGSPGAFAFFTVARLCVCHDIFLLDEKKNPADCRERQGKRGSKAEATWA